MHVVVTLFIASLIADEPVRPFLYVKQQTYQVTCGVKITSAGNGQRHQAGFVIPVDWPEQAVELVDESVLRATARVRRIKNSGAVVELTTPPLRQGERAEVVHTFRVTVGNPTFLDGDASLADDWPKPPGNLRLLLRPSPGIQSTDPKIRQLGNQIAQELPTDLERTRAFYRWTVENIDYQEIHPFTSAKTALETGNGDCEEMSALFIALCRTRGIAARTVWTPGHCWAEFRAVDAGGDEHWIPADPSRRTFGRLAVPAVILQKGDRFSGGRGPQGARRYLSSWYKGTRPPAKVENLLKITPIERVSNSNDPLLDVKNRSSR